MSLKHDRERVRIAAAKLLEYRRQLHRQTQWLSDGFERYRPAILIGGGLIAGLLIGRGKLNDVTRSIVSAAGLGWTLMRSSIGTMLLARSFQRPGRSDPQANRMADSQG